MTRLLVTTALALFIAQGTALANQANKSASETTGAATAQETTGAGQSKAQGTTATLPEKITQELKADGFSSVEVMPGSYVVTAKDKRGNPVTMFIGPHSMTMVKAIGSGSSQTTGSGSAADDSKDMSSDNK